MNKIFLQLGILEFFRDSLNAGLFLLLPFIAKDLHIGLTEVGSFRTLINIVVIISALPVSHLAIKFGGLKLLGFAMLFYGLGFVGSAFSVSYFTLMVTFLIVSLGTSIFTNVSSSLIAKYTDPEKRGSQIGLFNAIGDLGKVIVSGVITFVVVYIGWRFTAIVAAVLSLLIFVLYVFLNNTNKEKDGLNLQKQSKNIDYKFLFTHKSFMLSQLIYFLDTFATSPLFVLLPFFLLSKNITPSYVGTVTAMYYLGNVLSRVVFGRFVDSHGKSNIYIIGQILMAIFLILLVHATPLIIVIILSSLLGMVSKGTDPAVQSMIAFTVDEHGNYEKAFGISTMTESLGKIISPLCIGIIGDLFGLGSAFYLMALVALISIIPALFYNRFTK